MSKLQSLGITALDYKNRKFTVKQKDLDSHIELILFNIYTREEENVLFYIKGSKSIKEMLNENGYIIA